ncbi:MAG: sigma 54-interacting transcriptional regulator [Anaerolineae bacterium]
METVKPSVLLVEDDSDWLAIYCDGLESQEYDLDSSRTVDRALKLLGQKVYAVVITDLKMLGFGGDFGGFGVLQRAKELQPNTQVIVITAYGSSERAFQAMQQGAFDYVTKPVSFEKLRWSILSAMKVRQQKSRLKKHLASQPSSPGPAQKAEPRASAPTALRFDSIVGNSKSMEQVFVRVREAANSSLGVLVEGERGTGKELIARAIHYNSPRASKPFGRVVCEELERYLPAVQRSLTNFRAGALFLDDIGKLDKGTQAAVQHLVARCADLDIRVLASNDSSGGELYRLVAQGHFDGDLYTLLNQLAIKVPPLRQRKDGDDIPAMVGHFIRELGAQKQLAQEIRVSPAAMALLAGHDYRDANVRELREVVELALELIGDGDVIQPEHLPVELQTSEQAASPEKSAFQAPSLPKARQTPDRQRLYERLISGFDLEEINDLVFQLGLSPDDIVGDTIPVKARELVLYYQRRGRLDELQEALNRLRPHQG